MRAFIFFLAAAMLMVAGCPGSEPADECPSGGPRVCGTDGSTYANECFAREAGVEVAHEGDCPPADNGEESTGDEVECTDSDFGKNALEAGTAAMNGESGDDYCVGAAHVLEYYCSAGEMMSEAIECPEGMECSEGACVGEVCRDTDGGLEEHFRGTASKGEASYADACEDGSTVKEYYCEDNQVRSALVPCISGEACEEGVCVESECSDSDGGQDLFEKGTVRADKVVYIDTCVGGATVKEYYCSGGAAEHAVLECPEGYYCINSKCAEYACTDTDDGEYEDFFGIVRKGGNEYSDYCLDSETVYEYYCAGNEVSSSRIACGTDERCESGECVEESYCADSDGGRDEHEKGAVEDNDGEKEDYCLDGNRLREYYCSGDEADYEDIYCDRGEACESGECVPICTDSDGGIELGEYGIVNKGGSSYEDVCTGEHTLREYYCDGNAVESATMECPEGQIWCEEGECKHIILR